MNKQKMQEVPNWGKAYLTSVGYIAILFYRLLVMSLPFEEQR